MSASFGSNVLKLLTSKIATQAVSFITAPIIARIFLPEHFGTVQLFSSISGVFVVISCLRYELSIPLGKDKNEVMSSFVISIISTLAVTFVSFIFTLILKAKVALWLKSPELETFLWFLPLTVFFGGVGYAIRYYASRSGKFGAIAWAGFGSVSGSILITIPLGLIFGASAKFLFIGQITGMILTILMLFIFVSREFLSEARTADLSFGMIWETAKQHKKFPIYDIWTGLFNSASMQLPPIILGAYFSTKVVGYYTLGNRFVGLPMTLLGYSISQVFFPSAAKEYNDTGKLNNIVSNTFKKLVQIGIFPIMILGLLGGTLFGFVFGENWAEAGFYTQILSIYVLFQFMNSPMNILAILQRQGIGLVFNIGLLSSRLIAIIIGANFGEPRLAILAFSISSSIGYIVFLLYKLTSSFVSIVWGAKIFAIYLILSFVLVFPAFILALFNYNIALVVAIIFIATMIYLYYLYRFDSGFQKTIITIVNKSQLIIKRG